ncbi:MAG TPA: L,D-transpeptidase family protein [Pyrinomonadaceae bacterium]|nr:L,D-transpeptidase family protein [Pyrinomonadaceae bacterium]
MRRNVLIRLALVLAFAAACAPAHAVSAKTKGKSPLAGSRQVVLVTTPGWNSVRGTLRRFERRGARAGWTRVGEDFEVVVGRSGLGWGAGLVEAEADGPSKREGDGRAPAGVFTLTRAFGFAGAGEAAWLRMPYTPLTGGVECVDDTASAHYNRVVDRADVSAADWNSSERMREVGGYRWGVVVAHNARAVPGGGSCIFLHVWAGPSKGTAGCTAMPQPDLETLLRWLDAKKRPLLVQLPEAEYARLRPVWKLPAARTH